MTETSDLRPLDAAGPRPRDLPVEHADLPALGGHIGSEPEDFVVDELPLYEASGTGEHWYVRLRKRGATTHDLERAVASASGVPEREIGHAGLKDKHAVTTQWLSVPTTARSEPSSWKLPEPFEVLDVSRHDNKLRIGHLRGNRFSIRLVGVSAAEVERAQPLAQRIAGRGIGNYFGSQRFGHGQQNLPRALEALSRRRLGPRSGSRGKFLASVIQSEVFNRYAAVRLERDHQRLIEGEVVRLDGSRALFAVEDPDRENPRLEAGDLHLTGPIWGPKMKGALGPALALEQEALASLGLDLESLRPLGRSAPGTRRDLLVQPAELQLTPLEESSLRVEFVLPAGSYASLVIRALTRLDPWGRPDAAC